MSLASLIKRLQDIMRKDSGVDGDAQRLSQIVWLIFLKVFDYKEMEAELEDDYIPIIPNGYRWRDWADVDDVRNQLTGVDLINFVNNELIPVLSGNSIEKNGERVTPFDRNDDRSLMVKDFMKDVTNFMKDGYNLRDVVNLFNTVHFDNTSEAHEFNDVYETLLKGLQSAGSYGEFYTNRAITSFAIEKINPQLGGTLADWAAGTGGFLIDGLKYMQNQVTIGDVEAQEKLQHCVRGGEFKPMPYKLLTTNLLLNGIELPNIRYGSSLSEKNLNEFNGDDLVEYCALNPPYGGVATNDDKMCFPSDMRSAETADLFVTLAVKRLKENGRGIIVLPDGFLFGTDNTKVAIKKYLLKECNLHTIIRLPQSCFAPYTSIATNLLFFDKGSSTQETWFYRYDLIDGQKFSQKKNPMTRDKLNCIDKWWSNRVEIKDKKEDDSMTETWKSKKISINEIENANYSLDFCGYPNKEKIILSPEETIKNFKEEREKLDKEMDTKLDEILKLLGLKED